MFFACYLQIIKGDNMRSVDKYNAILKNLLNKIESSVYSLSCKIL
jgi:hypothetical protein